MRKHRRGVIAAILAVALLIGGYALTSGFAAGETYPDVSYRLYVTNYESLSDGTSMTMELYVYYANGTGKRVDRGAFGLRFPTGMEVAFAPDTENIELYPLYPTTDDSTAQLEMKADGQHFFLWNVTPTVTRGPEFLDIASQEQTVFGETIETQLIPKGTRMHVGTYTLTLDGSFPLKSAIGQLNWLDTALSQDPLYATSEDGISINAEIWNDTDQDGLTWYQGHYQDTDLEMYQVDIPLLFTIPDYWLDTTLTVLSYDPKKELTLTLCREDGTVVADGFEVPAWTGADDPEKLYAATAENTGTGTGPYYTTIGLEVYTLAAGQELTAGNYLLEIKKEGHLLQRLSLTLPGDSLSEAAGLPGKGEYWYLPAGDINPVKDNSYYTITLYGDNRIDMADRAQLLHLLGEAAVDKSEKEPESYYADIDGDGRVSQADLSILTSPQNYGKHTKEKEGY